MKHLLTIISCCLALSLSAQELTLDYPYNPDYENDGNVGVEDLLQLLAYFNMGFEVDDIVIDEVTLTQWLQTISQTLIAQQAAIDSLMSVQSNSVDSIYNQFLMDIEEFQSPNSTGSLSLEYPDGLAGMESVHIFEDYVVPEGKNLYITSFLGGDASELQINSRSIFHGKGNEGGHDPTERGHFALPIIATEADSIISVGGNPSIQGFLVDKQVEPVHFTLYGSSNGWSSFGPNSYTVPEGKILVILNLFNPVTWGLYMNGWNLIAYGYFNYFDGALATSCNPPCYGTNLFAPLVFNDEDIINKGNYGEFTINGYLMDEDYFDQNEVLVDSSEASSQSIYFNEPQQPIYLTEVSSIIEVGGNTYEENGCSGCNYSYDLYLPSSANISNGFEITVLYSSNNGSAPSLEVYSNFGAELFETDGQTIGRFVWYGDRWYAL